MNLEQFVDAVMKNREKQDPFEVLKAEYAASKVSIARGRPVAWKEALSVLSFAVNEPAKHFSAEDSLRLKKVLTPLISLVIAFMPHSTVQEMLALHAANKLRLVEVGDDSEVIVDSSGGAYYCYRKENGSKARGHYSCYIDCTGQPCLGLDEFPFRSLVTDGVVRPARLRFRDNSAALEYSVHKPDEVDIDDDGSAHLRVPGIAINDHYQPLNRVGLSNPRLSILAVPFIGGHNPDYSGVDFCEKASELVLTAILGETRSAPFSGSAG